MSLGTNRKSIIPTVTIVGLPAFPLSAEMYQAQSALSDPVRWLSLDYPGIGDVPLASEENYSMDFLADRVLALLDAVQCSSAVIMGTSMGGYVAMALWRKAPERIRGLILADTRADADTPDMAERRRDTVRDLRAQGVHVLRERLRQLFSESTRALHPEWIEAAHHRLSGMSAEALARLTLGLATRPDSTKLLSSITIPTLLLAGEHDTVTPPEGMHRMAQEIPESQFHLIPHAGHLAPWENSTCVNQHILEFVTSLSEQ